MDSPGPLALGSGRVGPVTRNKSRQDNPRPVRVFKSCRLSAISSQQEDRQMADEQERPLVATAGQEFSAWVVVTCLVLGGALVCIAALVGLVEN